MLDLTFYSRGKRAFGKEITTEWATIFCEEDDYIDEFTEGDFSFTKGDLRIKDVFVFESDTLNLSNIPDKIFEVIENIVEEKSPEVILISTMDFFKRAIHFSNKDEMEPQTTITETRDIVYYAMIGEEKSVLLVAWDSYVEPEEDEN